MTDYVENLWKNLHPGEPVPEFVTKKKEEYKQKAEQYQKDLNILSDTFDNEEVQNNLKQDKVQNLLLLEKHGVTVDTINSVYHLCQLNFSQGQYETASSMLNQFILLSTDNSLNTSAIWGKFACDLLTLNLTPLLMASRLFVILLISVVLLTLSPSFITELGSFTGHCSCSVTAASTRKVLLISSFLHLIFPPFKHHVLGLFATLLLPSFLSTPRTATTPTTNVVLKILSVL